MKRERCFVRFFFVFPLFSTFFRLSDPPSLSFRQIFLPSSPSPEQPGVEPVLLRVQQVVVEIVHSVGQPLRNSLNIEPGALLTSGAPEEGRGRGRGGDGSLPPARSSASASSSAPPQPQAERVPGLRVPGLALGERGQRAVVDEEDTRTRGALVPIPSRHGLRGCPVSRFQPVVAQELVGGVDAQQGEVAGLGVGSGLSVFFCKVFFLERRSRSLNGIDRNCKPTFFLSLPLCSPSLSFSLFVSLPAAGPLQAWDRGAWARGTAAARPRRGRRRMESESTKHRRRSHRFPSAACPEALPARRSRGASRRARGSSGGPRSRPRRRTKKRRERERRSWLLFFWSSDFFLAVRSHFFQCSARKTQPLRTIMASLCSCRISHCSPVGAARVPNARRGTLTAAAPGRPRRASAGRRQGRIETSAFPFFDVADAAVATAASSASSFEPRLSPAIALSAALAALPPIIYWYRVAASVKKRLAEEEKDKEEEESRERERLEKLRRLRGEK